MTLPKEGQRVRLTSKMVNPNSAWMPEEDIPVGTEGTVTYVAQLTKEDFQIGVDWDNGRGLGLLPHDQYEII